VSAAVNGDKLHLYVGVVPPEYLLDANAVCHPGLARLRRAGDVVEVSKILRRLPRRSDLAVPVKKPRRFTSPPLNGTMGSSVPFMIRTEEVP
jgi:hypothetical protein